MCIWLAALGAALLGVAPGVAAQGAEAPKRVAVVGMAPSLVIAVSSTLEPWRIDVAAPLVPLPEGSMAAMVQGARGVAAGSEAAAVVWIAVEGGETTLLSYDRDEDKIIALPLASAPPFDEPTTAAVALSVKTLLRHSGLIPPEEIAVAAPAPLAPPRLLVDLLGTARVRPGIAHPIEPRFGVAARWFPAVTRRFFALVARADTGMGTQVEAPGFVGRYTDVTAGLAGEARLALGRRWTAGLALGARLHVTELSGRLDGAPDVSEQRINPSLDFGLRVELRVWRLELGVWSEAAYMARRQEYLAGADTVLALPTLEAGAGMLLGLPLW